MSIHILGIRHHGVGSARNVEEALAQLQPDIVLVEGPPEAEGVLHWAAHPEMKPPVAMLAYNVEEPHQAVFYPFAQFSPEWIALNYGATHQIPVRMMDLPLSHTFALEKSKEKTTPDKSTDKATPVKPDDNLVLDSPSGIQPHPDPMAYLARIAGYDDSEWWWEHHFEHNYLKDQAPAHFEAVALAVEALREQVITPTEDRDQLREAYMRRIIRQAEKEGYARIVVVCGAWHGPALLNLAGTVREDEKKFKGLPKVKVAATWIPWTHTRLGLFSGYGASIVSPGWYEHRWLHPEDLGIRWLTKVAQLFRQKKMDTSTAHVIEAFRLAEALAALRGLPRPGLRELNEATQTVICFGDTVLLKLVEEELIVAHRMGKVPRALPKLPLQADFEFHQKKLRLEVGETRKEYELDLRKELDLSRSRFLHRLEILGIDWGHKQRAAGKGTFKEVWRLRWEPEMLIKLIEMGIWGNTLEAAGSRFLLDQSQRGQSITEVARFIQQAIPAELFAVIEKLLGRINELATISSDILELMGALVPLVDVSRYGNVRKTDLSAIHLLVEGLVTRICIGLPNACYGLDEDNAQKMFGHIRQVDEAIRLLENDLLTQTWYQTLGIMLDKQHISAVITGCTCRLLFDAKVMETEETARHFGLALSAGNEPAYAAGWLEGFLKGSGMILLLDHALWNILHGWVASLEEGHFVELLPILRRTFSRFDVGERRQLGEKARRGRVVSTPVNRRTQTVPDHFDPARAERVLPVVRQLLGI